MRNLVLGVLALALCITSIAQTPPTPEQVVDRVLGSVAYVLAGDGAGKPIKAGSAVVVKPEGILLTAFHVVDGARELQVRFKDGETYDDVQLLGVDKRRDIAAIRISGRLAAPPVASLTDVKPGASVYVVSQAGNLPWSASSGVISAVRPADEVPGAGNGYRLVQFTAPISPGSSGGILVDSNSRVIGIIVGAATGQNLNFAVPVESVLGLADSTPATRFASGDRLKLPGQPGGPALPTPGIDPQGPEKSVAIASRDPQVIMQAFRSVYVQCNSVWMKDEVVKNALRNHPDFQRLGLVIVEDRRIVDTILTTDRVLFTWDFTYNLMHQNTSIVLATGKFTKIDGITAAGAIANDMMAKLKKIRASQDSPRQKQDGDEQKKQDKPKVQATPAS